MISCQDFSGFLYDYVSGQLSKEMKEEAEQHVAGCLRCKVELEQYRQVIQLARQLPGVPPPHGLLQRFRGALQGRQREKPDGKVEETGDEKEAGEAE